MNYFHSKPGQWNGVSSKRSASSFFVKPLKRLGKHLNSRLASWSREASCSSSFQQNRANTSRTGREQQTSRDSGFGLLCFADRKKYGDYLLQSYSNPMHPMKLMEEIYGGIMEFNHRYDEGENCYCSFTATLIIAGRFIFKGTGALQISAMESACRAALAALHNSYMSPETKYCLPVEIGRSQHLLEQGLADKVASLVDNTFLELIRACPVLRGRKVIAGIVMTIGMDPDSARLICVTSGTKCVPGDILVKNICGVAVLDSHAEIVAKRSLRFFFMNELESCLVGDPRSIFYGISKGRFMLKPDYKFHLYISSLPCGDARINRSVFGNSNVGALRTKIEQSRTTVLVPDEGIQLTLDGVACGELARAMSCSDKIARFCVTGVQGGLLSQLLDEPIYLTSLVVGTWFIPSRLNESLFERVSQELGPLHPSYRHCQLLVATKSSPEVYVEGPALPESAQAESANWIVDAGLEVINSVTGFQMWASDKKIMGSKKASRLCKASLFRKWVELRKEVGRSFQLPDCDFDRLIYRNVKNAAYNYQETKLLANKALSGGGFSRWVKKPTEVDMFSLDNLKTQ